MSIKELLKNCSKDELDKFIHSYLQKELDDFVFGSQEEKNKFTSYQDPRFPTKTPQIKSLFTELKEDKWKRSWKMLIDPKWAFSLGNFESYLTQGYQKHIHNLTKKFVNLEEGQLTFWVSESCLLSNSETSKFVEEHRENQYKVLKHIMEKGENMGWKEFFDLMDEARKCNVVTVTENTKLQPYQLESGIGEWRNDYEKSKVNLVNLCNQEEVLDFIRKTGEVEIIFKNIQKLRKRNFSGTKEILDSLISIINKG